MYQFSNLHSSAGHLPGSPTIHTLNRRMKIIWNYQIITPCIALHNFTKNKEYTIKLFFNFCSTNLRNTISESHRVNYSKGNDQKNKHLISLRENSNRNSTCVNASSLLCYRNSLWNDRPSVIQVALINKLWFRQARWYLYPVNSTLKLKFPINISPRDCRTSFLFMREKKSLRTFTELKEEIFDFGIQDLKQYYTPYVGGGS